MYRSAQLSQSHRAQGRFGSFEVTAFGKSLSLAPGVEFSAQVDAYSWFDHRAPFGIKGLGSNGSGLNSDSAFAKALFSDEAMKQYQSLDSNANGKVEMQELLVASFVPFNYTPKDGVMSTWPRPDLGGLEPWDGHAVSVLAAGLNFVPKFQPIKTDLPSIPIVKGIAEVTPYFRFEVGAGWKDQANDLRTKLQKSIAKTGSLEFSTSDFERREHPFQAPDVTGDVGSLVSVKPEIGFTLHVGPKAGKRFSLGVDAALGFAVDLQPSAVAGVSDLARPLNQALIDSNRGSELECKANFHFENNATCSNKTLAGSNGSYLCTRATSHSSCLVTLNVQDVGRISACIDESSLTGKDDCTAEKVSALGDHKAWSILKDVFKKSSSKIDAVRGHANDIKAVWSNSKSCADCKADGTCPDAYRAPLLGFGSACEERGYCCSAAISTWAPAEPKPPTPATAYLQCVRAMVVAGGKLIASDGNVDRTFDLLAPPIATNQPASTRESCAANPGGLTIDPSGCVYRTTTQKNTGLVLTSSCNGLWNLNQTTTLGQGLHLAWAKGDIYISAREGTIWRLGASGTAATLYAAVEQQTGFVDGDRATARFNAPEGIAFDGADALYIADAGNNAIRKIILSTGQVSTVAGGTPGFRDGIGATAQFNAPYAVTVSGQSLLVTDRGNAAVRRVNLQTSAVTTVAGDPSRPTYKDGVIAEAGFVGPRGIAADSDGNIYVGDANGAIRKIGSDCNANLPQAIKYDVTESACSGGSFKPYRCNVETRSTGGEFQGPGCHPLISGFPSACGCSSDLDCSKGESCDPTRGQCLRTCTAQAGQSGVVCPSGETCVKGLCEGPSTCSCDANATGLTCAGGKRSCFQGACAIPCAGGVACPTGQQCLGNGMCGLTSGQLFAEQIAWSARNPGKPAHSVASYAYSELKLLASLNADIDVKATIKLLKKQRTLHLWRWGNAWDLGSTAKGSFQAGLEAQYHWDGAPEGKVRNLQPDRVNQCGVIDASLDHPDELVNYCAATTGMAATDPMPPSIEDITQSITDVTSFVKDIKDNLVATEGICIGGKRMEEWFADPANLESAYAGARCRLADAPSSSDFPCNELSYWLAKRSGCLQMGRSGPSRTFASAMAVRGNFSLMGADGDFKLLDMRRDKAGPADIDNLQTPNQVSQSVFSDWVSDVDSCVDGSNVEDVACGCVTDASCTGGPDQRCVEGSCVADDGRVARCPLIETKLIAPGRCCGDGTVIAGEDCDDGNTKSGDGCSASCRSESRGSCILPDGCRDLGSNNNGKPLTAAGCRALRGNVVFGYTCADTGSTINQSQGTCTINGGCMSGANPKQCALGGGSFSVQACPKCLPKPTGMVAYYPFDGLIGSQLTADLAGTNNANVSANVGRVPGKAAGAFSFTTGLDFVRAPIALPSGSFSILMWVRPTEATGAMLTSSQQVAQGALGRFALAPNRLQFTSTVTRGSSTAVESSPLPSLVDGQWHLVGVSLAGQQSNGGTFWLDGKAVGTFDPTQVGGLSSMGKFSIGGDNHLPFKGGIDEVMVFDRALYAAEVKALALPSVTGICR